MDTTASISQYWPKIETKLPRLVNILLIILILITLAKLLWSFFDSGIDAAELNKPVNTSNTIKPQPRPQYDRRIAQMHIMGKAVTTTSKAIKDAPDTTLNLKLLGVLAGDKEYGYAIISSGANKVKHYALGDDVPGGATLHAVYPDRVILERDIRMETLRLPKSQDAKFGKKLTSKKTTSTPQKSTTSSESFENLGQFRDVIKNNPVTLTKYINVVPEKDTDTGEFKGFKLSPSTNSEMFYQLGLQPGDLVTNINGIQLDQENKGIEAMNALADAAEVTLIVQREGTEITLFQDLSQ